MAQIQKMELQLDFNSSAESFYEIIRSKRYLFPKICPEVVKDVKVIKGDWESIGSIKEWTYVAGNSETSKEILEAIDDENKVVTFKAGDGEMAKYYKTLRATIQVIGKGQVGGSVKWTLEYEKQNENIPAPIKYLDLIPILTKNIDTYLTKDA